MLILSSLMLSSGLCEQAENMTQLWTVCRP